MLVKFLKTGQVDSVVSDDYWGQGENNADVLQVQFYSNDAKTEYYNLSNYTVDCVVERPDGVISPALVLSTVSGDNTTAQLSITNWITEVPGEIKFIIRMKVVSTGVINVTGICYRVIGEGIAPADQTITDVQYAALETSINTLDSRLDAQEYLHYTDNSNTIANLYTATSGKPCLVKSGTSLMLIMLVLSGTTYNYTALVLEDSSNTDNEAKAWARTYTANGTDTIASVISGIKSTNYRIQSKADLTTALASYTTTTALTTLLAGKVDTEDGKGLSTNDFTDAYKAVIDALTTTYAAKSIETNVANIEAKIPSAASDTNQLADKAFVNSTIATATSYFLGTLDVVTDLSLSYGASTSAIATALNSYSFASKTNNDYCFVINQDTSGNTLYQRFKWNGTTFLFEFALNNSSFTAAQWAAITSGITSAKVTQYDAYSSGKLDKVTTSGNERVYGVDASGNQENIVVVNANTANTIAKRDASGNIQVGTPSNTTDAVPKSYVDGKVFTPTLTLLSDGSYNFSI